MAGSADSPARRRRERRMHQAAELRLKGYSLRAIAAQLEVSHVTIRNDLRLWDQRQDAKWGELLAEPPGGVEKLTGGVKKVTASTRPKGA